MQAGGGEVPGAGQGGCGAERATVGAEVRLSSNYFVDMRKFIVMGSSAWQSRATSLGQGSGSSAVDLATGCAAL